MLYYGLKITITLMLIIAASEIAKRSTLLGGLIASIPIVSVLAMVWLYVETRSAVKVELFARDIFWMVLPSLSLFICLPLLLKQGWNFWLSLGVSIAVMFGCYLLVLILFKDVSIGMLNR